MEKAEPFLNFNDILEGWEVSADERLKKIIKRTLDHGNKKRNGDTEEQRF